jgi:hypothetical protein
VPGLAWLVVTLAGAAPVFAQPVVTVRVVFDSAELREGLGASRPRIARRVTDRIVELAATRFGYLDWRSGADAPAGGGNELVARVFERGVLRCRPRQVALELRTTLQPSELTVYEVVSPECDRGAAWLWDHPRFADALLQAAEKLAPESFDRLGELIQDNVSLVDDLALEQRIEASSKGVFLLVPATRLRAGRRSQLEVDFTSAAEGDSTRQGYFWIRTLEPGAARTECEVGKFSFPEPPGNPSVDGWIRTHESLVELVHPSVLRDLTVLMKEWRPLYYPGKLSPKRTVLSGPGGKPR